MRLKKTVVTAKHFYFTKKTHMKMILPAPSRDAYFVKTHLFCVVQHFVTYPHFYESIDFVYAGL